MKKEWLEKTLVIVIIVTILNLIFIPSSQTISIPNKHKDKKLIIKEKNNLESVIKVKDVPITSKKIENLLVKNNQKEDNTINFEKLSDKIHPTFDRTNTGIHIAAFHDETLNGLKYIVSNDDGRTYKEAFWGEFGDYPVIRLWDKKIFCGVSVTNDNDPHGAIIYFFICEDPEITDSCSIYMIQPYLPHAPPFGKMRDSALACDNSQKNYFYWGAASYTINIGSFNYVPMLLYPEIPSSYLFRMSYYEIENCYHTDIDIDKTTHTIFAVYDCYNITTDSWNLYVRVKDFLNLQNGYDNLYKIQNSAGLQYPVIAANNNVEIILAENEENGNKDIVCLRSINGFNTSQKSFLTSSGDDERFPEIEYVYNNTFVCTFIKNETLYKIVTENGGLTWSIPEVIDTDVVADYKSVTISTSANQIIYEKYAQENIYLSVIPINDYKNDPDLQIPFISGGDKIDIGLLNKCGSDEFNIYWGVNISGAINKKLNGVIPFLNASELYTLTIDNLQGSGDINLQVVFELPGRQKIIREIVGDINKNYIENILFLWDESKIFYVDDNGMHGGLGTIDNPFITIEHALWFSSNGYTIYVKEGTYHLNFGTQKSVRILGENKNNTVIEGDVYLSGCGILYSGFKNLGSNLHLSGEYNRVTDCIVLGGYIVIGGFSNYVINNNIGGSRWGIVFESSGSNLVKQNIIENCSESGVHFRGDITSNIISDNKILKNYCAIDLYKNENNDFTNNVIRQNTYGILLIESSNNFIKSNTFENNTYGIYIKNSGDNKIIKNNFILNNYSATFHHYSRSYHNTWLRNYWDDKGLIFIKFIFGKITYYYGLPPYQRSRTINWINIDLFPAFKPYDI